ncbi:hypothetical protein [Silvibacterium sp.]|uniref:hypothetical protein n=1 Tax=Silvibacterium sp. TaxID=1964179 RepID=UPI0039E3EF70
MINPVSITPVIDVSTNYRTTTEVTAPERTQSGRATTAQPEPDRTLRSTASPAIQPLQVTQRPALERDQVTLTGEQVLTAPAYAGTLPRTEQDDAEYQYDPV